jgi:hypothetical protein
VGGGSCRKGVRPRRRIAVVGEEVWMWMSRWKRWCRREDRGDLVVMVWAL